MPIAQRFVRVLCGAREPGKCKFCRRPIEWVTTQESKNIPLNPGAFVLHVDKWDSGVKWDVLASDAAHLVTCKRRPEKPSKAATPRSWAGGRH